MKKIILLLVLLYPFLHAEMCENKRFSLSAYQNRGGALTLMDLVRDVAQTCNISVVFEDKRAKERLSQPLDMVNIQDYSVPELFTFIFDEHNLFHTYDPIKGVVRVSYTNTVNFNIDYINMSELVTESTKSITVGPSTNTGANTTGTTGSASTSNTSSSSGSTGSNGGANSDYTNVRAISTFTFWDQLQNHIQQILQVDEEYNEALNKTLVNRDAAVVTITGTKRQIDGVKRYLNKLESRMHSQVMLEAHLIELTYNDYSSIGVNWSDFSLALTGSYSNAYTNIVGTSNPIYKFGVDFNPAGLINFLKTYGDVEVLSNPKILTLSNQPAVINVGQQLSYLYQNGAIASSNTQTSATTTNTLGSVFVGLTLNIIPEVTEDGYIIMRINPITSELLNENELSSNSSTTGSSTTQTQRTMPPDTRVKQMTSIVKVKDSQKVLIGGLIEKKISKDNTKVPFIGDVPLFGRLFNNDTDTVRKSELFILITPTLIKQDVFPSIDDAILKRFD
ncbi:secretin N-terminal domain-containing protein [Sulfuricurvum sp.]|uniref:secretin N-terminal domain-containing protein n=1 Tax=Sulfuricurvum sp. TaxID=2025608 RepID=UPI002613B0D1|nr:secretin N-terminal domain-containing protein [Sulfuricurvum sp.]MDD2782009.1 secretin N-terminal domain-containing protein [Sulfuricurvum sp.]